MKSWRGKKYEELGREKTMFSLVEATMYLLFLKEVFNVALSKHVTHYGSQSGVLLYNPSTSSPIKKAPPIQHVGTQLCGFELSISSPVSRTHVQ